MRSEGGIMRSVRVLKVKERERERVVKGKREIEKGGEVNALFCALPKHLHLLGWLG